MLNLGGDAIGRFVRAWGCDGIEGARGSVLGAGRAVLES